MAGDPSTSDHSPKPSSAARKSRWEPPAAAKPKPKPKPSPKPTPPPAAPPLLHRRPSPAEAAAPPPLPQPTYGFHMLERRTIVLADGSVRSYYALPPDYHHLHDFPQFLPHPPQPRFMPPPGPAPGRQQDYWNSLGLDSGKRKVRNEDEEEAPRGMKMARPVVVVATKHSEVDQGELKKAFLRFVKTVNEGAAQRRSYLENSRLHCPACPSAAAAANGGGRPSRDFPDTHSLVMHCYNSEKADLLVDHLGLHKALCALMGWSYSVPPDNSKAYQRLSADEAAANQDDLIMWPPLVIIHNTLTAKNKEGRMEGLGNKYMDNRIRDLGFSGGKSKSLYGREGHLGTTLIKFAGDQAGLAEAMRLADYFERGNHGRGGWARLQPLTLGGPDDENNPLITNLEERARDKKRIFYGYLGTSNDMDRIDFDTRKKIAFESLREFISSE